MRTVSLVTLGCARNEVDSEELAARLTASGWDLTSADEAKVVLVNTCGFIQAAKAESIAELLSAADSRRRNTLPPGPVHGAAGPTAAAGLVDATELAVAARLVGAAAGRGWRSAGVMGSSVRRSRAMCAGRRRPASTSSSRAPMSP